MSLLREIQNEASNSLGQLTDLLRKCKILSVRLKSKEIGEWTEQELNGYRKDSQLPDYRVFSLLEARGNFVVSLTLLEEIIEALSYENI